MLYAATQPRSTTHMHVGRSSASNDGWCWSKRSHCTSRHTTAVVLTSSCEHSSSNKAQGSTKCTMPSLLLPVFKSSFEGFRRKPKKIPRQGLDMHTCFSTPVEVNPERLLCTTLPHLWTLSSGVLLVVSYAVFRTSIWPEAPSTAKGCSGSLILPIGPLATE